MWCSRPQVASDRRRRWRRFAGLGLAVIGLAGVVSAGDAALDITIPDGAVSVGDRLPIRVQARGGESGLWGDLALSVPESGSWVVASGPREVLGATPPAWELTLVPLDVGEIDLPEIEVSLRDADGAVVAVKAESRPRITVGSVLAPEDDGQPAPMLDPKGVEGFPWEWVLPAAVVAFPVLAIAGWLWSRRRRGERVASAPRLSPLAELGQLLGELQAAIGRQPAEVVCDRLAHGVRLYLERRTGEPAVEMTSHELRLLARRDEWPRSVQAELKQLTTTVDGVRFGRRGVTGPDLQASCQAAEDLGRNLEAHLQPEPPETGAAS